MIMVKKFHLFAGRAYYPSPGLDDYIGAFDTLADAQALINEDKFDWATVAALRSNGELGVFATWSNGLYLDKLGTAEYVDGWLVGQKYFD